MDFHAQAYGIHWVMPGSVEGLLSCWHQWLGKHNSNIWNLIPGCIMWIVWLERNRRSFENMEKTLDELKVLSQCSLFEWSRCWGFIESSSLPEFFFSLRLSIWFPSPSFGCLFLLFLIVHHHEQLVFFIFFLLIIVLLLPIKKKKLKVYSGINLGGKPRLSCINFGIRAQFDLSIFSNHKKYVVLSTTASKPKHPATPKFIFNPTVQTRSRKPETWKPHHQTRKSSSRHVSSLTSPSILHLCGPHSFWVFKHLAQPDQPIKYSWIFSSTSPRSSNPVIA